MKILIEKGFYDIIGKKSIVGFGIYSCLLFNKYFEFLFLLVFGREDEDREVNKISFLFLKYLWFRWEIYTEIVS